MGVIGSAISSISSLILGVPLGWGRGVEAAAAAANDI
jgi:hypothetical protein